MIIAQTDCGWFQPLSVPITARPPQHPPVFCPPPLPQAGITFQEQIARYMRELRKLMTELIAEHPVAARVIWKIVREIVLGSLPGLLAWLRGRL